MSGLSLAIQSAREAAQKVLRDNPHVVKKETTDVEKIANINGITVRDENFDNDRVAGLIQFRVSDGKPEIVINKDSGVDRRRFTIAHELGHFFLHNKQTIHVDDLDTAEMVFYRDENSSQATHLNEIQANQFAAELLMPRESIIENIKKLRANNIGLSEIVGLLADQYQVSVTAMAIRVSNLNNVS